MGIEAPARVVVLWPTSHGNVGEFPFAAVRTLSERMRSLHDVALVGSVNWFTRLKPTSDAPGEVMSMAAVSASFFDVLRAPPLLGRTFRPADDRSTAPPVLILSHGLWVRRFGQDPNVIGRVAYLGDDPVEIVGVMRPEFFYPRGAEFWMPAGPLLAESAQAQNVPLDNILNGVGTFYGVARLAEGSTVDRVRAETLSYIAQAVPEQKLDVSSAGISVTSLPDQIFAAARPALLALMGAVVAVLLIACTNVAALLLARDASRTRETAVHAALGASRWTLVSQRLADSGVIAVSGAVIGVAAAALAVRPLVFLSPADIPRLDTAAIDLGVLAFAVALTVLTTLVVGLLPAWRLRRASVASDLKGAATGTTERSGRVGISRWLVTLQVATTVVLLIASALSVRSFVRLASLDLGFDPAHVLTFTVLGTDDTRVDTREQGDDLLDRLLARLQQDPRVVAAGAVNQLPFTFGPIGWDASFVLEGQLDSRDTRSRNPPLNFLAVTPDYFKTMGIRLIRGREFADRDRTDAPYVVIVSEALADRAWPGQDPLGKRIRTNLTLRRGDHEPTGWQTVVGVVATARYREIQSPRLDLYAPFRQADPIAECIVVRTTVPPERLVPAVASVVKEIDATTVLDRVKSMDTIVRHTRGPWLFSTLVFSLFGVVALGLSGLGLFGLVAYAVAQRRREIGIRIALGARPSGVVGLMVRQGMGPAVYGLLAGVCGAVLVTRLLASLLFDTSPTDVPTFSAVAAGFAFVSFVASYLPARRAASVSPVVALRAE
jgi:predicted permease